MVGKCRFQTLPPSRAPRLNPGADVEREGPDAAGGNLRIVVRQHVSEPLAMLGIGHHPIKNAGRDAVTGVSPVVGE